MTHTFTPGQKIEANTYCLQCSQVQTWRYCMPDYNSIGMRWYKCGLPRPTFMCKAKCQWDNPTRLIPSPPQVWAPAVFPGNLCMCRYCKEETIDRVCKTLKSLYPNGDRDVDEHISELEEILDLHRLPRLLDSMSIDD